MIKTGLLSFRDYRDAYAGRRAIIVGSGPTQFNYAELNTLGDPKFFINDAVFIPDVSKKNDFFFTHHSDMRKFLHLDVIYIRQIKKIIDGIVYQTAFRASHNSFIPISVVWCGSEATVLEPWVFDKDYITNSGRLAGNGGSITSLLHFLWYCGFTSIFGVGIHPTFISRLHDYRVFRATQQHRPTKTPGLCPGLPTIVANQLVYMSAFGFDVEYAPCCYLKSL